MNGRRLDWLTHAILGLGVLIFAFPIYVALVASTQDSGTSCFPCHLPFWR